jgi:hypothetical protein
MKALTSEDLQEAFNGSYYTITGTAEPLDEWVSNYEGLLHDHADGKPVEWFTTTGEAVNAFAANRLGRPIRSGDKFKPGLTFLLFPLTDLNTGKLAMFKMRMQDRWFDDIINNMRAMGEARHG